MPAAGTRTSSSRIVGRARCGCRAVTLALGAPFRSRRGRAGGGCGGCPRPWPSSPSSAWPRWLALVLATARLWPWPGLVAAGPALVLPALVRLVLRSWSRSCLPWLAVLLVLVAAPAVLLRLPCPRPAGLARRWPGRRGRPARDLVADRSVRPVLLVGTLVTVGLLGPWRCLPVLCARSAAAARSARPPDCLAARLPPDWPGTGLDGLDRVDQLGLLHRAGAPGMPMPPAIDFRSAISMELSPPLCGLGRAVPVVRSAGGGGFDGLRHVRSFPRISAEPPHCRRLLDLRRTAARRGPDGGRRKWVHGDRGHRSDALGGCGAERPWRPASLNRVRQMCTPTSGSRRGQAHSTPRVSISRCCAVHPRGSAPAGRPVDQGDGVPDRRRTPGRWGRHPTPRRGLPRRGARRRGQASPASRARGSPGGASRGWPGAAARAARRAATSRAARPALAAASACGTSSGSRPRATWSRPGRAARTPRRRPAGRRRRDGVPRAVAPGRRSRTRRRTPGRRCRGAPRGRRREPEPGRRRSGSPARRPGPGPERCRRRSRRRTSRGRGRAG